MGGVPLSVTLAMKKQRVIVSRRKDDIRAVKQLAADWRSGWLAGDADALLLLYAEEPVLMAQGHPAIVGKTGGLSRWCRARRAFAVDEKPSTPLRFLLCPFE